MAVPSTCVNKRGSPMELAFALWGATPLMERPRGLAAMWLPGAVKPSPEKASLYDVSSWPRQSLFRRRDRVVPRSGEFR